MNWKRFLSLRKVELFTISAILALSAISFGIFNSKILFSDDWSFVVARFVFGNLYPIDLADRRPLLLALHYGLASLFGLQLQYYYFFNFVVISLSAILVYVIVRKIFPEQGWIASLVALAYLVYPVDYTRTWMITISNRFWWLVSLGAVWLLLEFVSSSKAWMYALALPGIAIPLGAYEAQFGVLLLAGVSIALFSRKAPIKHRFLVLAAVIVIGVAFSLWRTFLQTKFFQVKDAYVESLQFRPAILVERYLQGLYIFFIGWLDPIMAQLKLLGFNLIPWILFYSLACCVAMIWITSKTSSLDRLETHQKISEAKDYLKMFLIGIAFWIAGYFPIIALYRPALAPVSSRVNFYSVPGAAMMLVSVVALIATLLTNSNFTKRFTVTAIILPFILAGTYVQLQVNQENQLKWEAQKRIWNSVFTTIPNLQDECGIVIIIPGYQSLRPFETYPFVAGWEVDSGAQVLYNKPNIGGNYYYKDLQPAELLFVKRGFRQIPTDKPIPYKKLVFVYYDPASGTSTLVEDLEKTLGLSYPVSGYHPQENIISSKPSTTKFRWLVE